MKAALAAGAIGALLLGQAAAPQQPIRSEANFVRVDVHPTLRGAPVKDLTRDDFEILEDGVPQKVEAFEQISRPSLNTVTTRRDPSSAGESRQAVVDVRGHVFVLFLDAPHVSSAGSGAIGAPLARLLDRIVGPDDLVGVMTPEMPVSQMVFARKTDVLRDGLLTNPNWGRRFDRTKLDQAEQNYVACYPLTYSEAEQGRMLSQVAQELIERRRERMTLNAFEQIIAVVGATTQARTTVLTVTEGWALYRTDKTLLEPRMYNENDPVHSPIEPPPGGERIGITRGGKLGVKDPSDLTSVKYACESDRLRLANIDDRQDFQDLWALANRHNVSFYTIDPRGLTSFDTEVQVDPPRGVKNGLDWDHASLSSRQGAMRDLANNTDGLAIMNSLQFDRNLQQIIDDLASYYLLGYYSTNPKLDGKYREITVRVKRAEVNVRARRGYRAPTKEDVAARPATAATAAAPAAAALPKPAVFRRGPATGNRQEPAAGVIFSRTERLHLEVRLEPDMKNGSARFLDRAGQPMALPVTVGERTDPDGRRWLTADVTLAPLAPGNYAIELSATDTTGARTVLTPIQVTR